MCSRIRKMVSSRQPSTQDKMLKRRKFTSVRYPELRYNMEGLIIILGWSGFLASLFLLWMTLTKSGKKFPIFC